MKQWLWILLLALTLSGTAAAASSSSGYCNDAGTVIWLLDSGGGMIIRGAGEMKDWGTRNQVPWNRSRSLIRSVTVEDGVTNVGSNAFAACGNLSSVSIPSGVRQVGDYAFSGCPGLTAVSLAEGVQSLGKNAFSGCSALPAITIPHSVREIGQYAFSGCRSLETMSLTGSVILLSTGVFQECASLRRVDLPASLQEIGQRAFSGCSALPYLTIPASVSTIRDYAIENCPSLTDLYYPAGEAAWNAVNEAFNRENVRRPLTQFREQIARQGIAVHLNAAGPAEEEIRETPAITGVSVEGNTVTVDFSRTPEAGSRLYVAAYGENGRFLGLRSCDAGGSSWAAVTGLDTAGAVRVTAFLTDRNGRPAAEAVEQSAA